jgi:glycolate oxidase FAD binding subunit
VRECSLLTSAVQIHAASHVAPSASVLIEGLPAVIESKADRIKHAALAAGATVSDASDDVWLVREQLFEDKGTSFAVVRIGVLPTQYEGLVATLEGDVDRSIRWQLVLQAVGTGLVRLASTDADALVVAISRFRAALADLGGSFVVLRRPPECSAAIDVWGKTGDALPLMKCIKRQFDPKGTVNAGRFVGGI